MEEIFCLFLGRVIMVLCCTALTVFLASLCIDYVLKRGKVFGLLFEFILKRHQFRRFQAHYRGVNLDDVQAEGELLGYQNRYRKVYAYRGLLIAFAYEEYNGPYTGRIDELENADGERVQTQGVAR